MIHMSMISGRLDSGNDEIVIKLKQQLHDTEQEIKNCHAENDVLHKKLDKRKEEVGLKFNYANHTKSLQSFEKETLRLLLVEG